MRILIFAGAGTSVELGVPAMMGMAIEFAAHAEQWNVQPALVQQTLAEHQDVEYLIEVLDKVCGARESIEALSSSQVELSHFVTVRSEIEWFVQHVAERVNARDATLMWGPVLRAVKSHEASFVTTNYDRAIELAANAEGVHLADGFARFYKQFVENESFKRFVSDMVFHMTSAP